MCVVSLTLTEQSHSNSDSKSFCSAPTLFVTFSPRPLFDFISTFLISLQVTRVIVDKDLESDEAPKNSWIVSLFFYNRIAYMISPWHELQKNSGKFSIALKSRFFPLSRAAVLVIHLKIVRFRANVATWSRARFLCVGITGWDDNSESLVDCSTDCETVEGLSAIVLVSDCQTAVVRFRVSIMVEALRDILYTNAMGKDGTEWSL